MRDASGNMVSTYEQTVDSGGALSDPVQTEVPVYGSGKIGLYKPQFGLTFYELTDHLGNVRAVIGDKISAAYLATMEPERFELEQDFLGVTSTSTSDFINHTPTVVSLEGQTTTIANPNRVSG